jgi:hypothetical protein
VIEQGYHKENSILCRCFLARTRTPRAEPQWYRAKSLG